MVFRVILAIVFVTKLTKTEPEIKEIHVPVMPSQRSPAVFSSTVVLKEDGGNFESAHSKLLENCLPRLAASNPSARTQPCSTSPTANHKLPKRCTPKTSTMVALRSGTANGPMPTIILKPFVPGTLRNFLTFMICATRKSRSTRRTFRIRKTPVGPSPNANTTARMSGITIAISKKNQVFRYFLPMLARSKHKL